ncbi:hypothetical protein D3C83_64120 [compost metagenome]
MPKVAAFLRRMVMTLSMLALETTLSRGTVAETRYSATTVAIRSMATMEPMCWTGVRTTTFSMGKATSLSEAFLFSICLMTVPPIRCGAGTATII